MIKFQLKLLFLVLSISFQVKAQDPAENWDETFHDRVNQLYWTNELTAAIAYRDAMEVCASLNSKGQGSGWRLPGVVELEHLYQLTSGQSGQWQELKSDVNRDGCVDFNDKNRMQLGTSLPTPCRGDFDVSLIVDQADLDIWESEQGQGCGSAQQAPHAFDINKDGIVNFKDQSRATSFLGLSNVTWCEGDVNNDGYVTQADLDLLDSHLGECGGTGHNCKNRSDPLASCGESFLSKAACDQSAPLWILANADEELLNPSIFNLSSGGEIPASFGAQSGLRCVRRADGGLPELPKRRAWMAVEGDGNRDGSINLEDLNNVRNSFGSIGTNLSGDGNQDGIIDLKDLNDVRNKFGYILPPPEIAYYRGDTNCDREFTQLDAEAMNTLISNRELHRLQFPHCQDDNIGDMNCDGFYNDDDYYWLQVALEDEEYYEAIQQDCGVNIGR